MRSRIRRIHTGSPGRDALGSLVAVIALSQGNPGFERAPYRLSCSILRCPVAPQPEAAAAKKDRGNVDGQAFHLRLQNAFAALHRPHIQMDL